MTRLELKNRLNIYNVLFVEDDKVISEEMVEFLGRFFKNVYYANNGADAIELFKLHDIRLVITDIKMPTLDGLEMALVLKDLNPNIPIITITAHNEIDMLEKIKECKIDYYIGKPFEPNKLIEKFIEIVNNDKI
ncbi:MAG: response regulator [Campylobacterales bacterium]|nr:response regulator [Campylobacterales bacterium]